MTMDIFCRFGEKTVNAVEFVVPYWALYAAAGALFLMLLAIVVLSICMCKACKIVKKLKRSQGGSENTYEADVHYAELQNLPASGRGQCDGGTSPESQAVQNSDYATVAVLKETPSEENSGSALQREDSGVEDGVREDQICEEAE
ncbi:leukocyte-specific transcript 1 protein isoform X2 [Python bivittatus]|nr:leukocyte-specific transcript 1 protein isoform X2 [Python bivittatus]